MLAPKLIQLEEEIDAEIAGEEPLEPPAQRITCDLMSLDEMVSKEEKEPPPPPPKPPAKKKRVNFMSLDEMVRSHKLMNLTFGGTVHICKWPIHVSMK